MPPKKKSPAPVIGRTSAPGPVEVRWSCGGDSGRFEIERDEWNKMDRDERFNLVNDQLDQAVKDFPVADRSRYTWTISESEYP